MAVTIEQFRSVVGYTNPKLDQWFPHMLKAMEKAEINTPLRQSHFLAQVSFESNALTTLRELYNGPSREQYFENKYGVGKHKDAIDMGHTIPGYGAKYWGRGPIQCTWYNNYLAFGKWVGIDAVGNPDLLLTPEYGSAFCSWFWITRKINLQSDKDSLTGVTRLINGGQTGLVGRALCLKRAKSILLPTRT